MRAREREIEPRQDGQLRRNVLANYLSQIYVAIITIVMLPLYVQYMGAEAYGLVGFFTMLQVWFNLLDMGLTPTVARETARFRGGAADRLSYRRLVRVLEMIFLTVAVIGGSALVAASSHIAGGWLQASELSAAEVQTSVQFMGIIVATRWMAGLYRGVINGSERMVWLGAFNSLVATARFIGVLPVLIFVDASPKTFFGYQLAVAAFEICILTLYSYRLLPGTKPGEKLTLNWAPLKPVIGFSLTIAFTSSVWILVTQTDKLILSRILPLAEYGYFTLAVVVASGILVFSIPVSTAIMPRMSKLEAEGDEPGVIQVYRQATQLVSVLAGSACITMAFFADRLLWAWTGNSLFVQNASLILVLYALGNGILSVSGFPYYLQYAKGDLRLHLIGNAVFVVLLVPLIVFFAIRLGAIGAGYVWLGMNLLLFVFWLPVIHRKFAPGLNLKWYVRDILAIVAPAAFAGFVLSRILEAGDDRIIEMLKIGFAGLIVLLSAAIASSEVRRSVSKLANRA